MFGNNGIIRIGIANFEPVQAQDWFYRLDGIDEIDVSILEIEQVPAATSVLDLVILPGSYEALGVLDNPLSEYQNCFMVSGDAMEATDMALFMGVPDIVNANFTGEEILLKLRKKNSVQRHGKEATALPRTKARIEENIAIEDGAADQMLIARLRQRRASDARKNVA